MIKIVFKSLKGYWGKKMNDEYLLKELPHSALLKKAIQFYEEDPVLWKKAVDILKNNGDFPKDPYEKDIRICNMVLKLRRDG